MGAVYRGKPIYVAAASVWVKSLMFCLMQSLNAKGLVQNLMASAEFDAELGAELGGKLGFSNNALYGRVGRAAAATISRHRGG